MRAYLAFDGKMRWLNGTFQTELDSFSADRRLRPAEA